MSYCRFFCCFKGFDSLWVLFIFHAGASEWEFPLALQTSAIAPKTMSNVRSPRDLEFYATDGEQRTDQESVQARFVLPEILLNMLSDQLSATYLHGRLKAPRQASPGSKMPL